MSEKNEEITHYSEVRLERQNWLQRLFRNQTAHRIGDLYMELSGPFARHGRRRLTEHVITLKHLPVNFHGYRIVHLTDLHVGRSMCGRRWFSLMDQVNALEPDVILMTGDYYSWGTRYLEEGAKGIAKLHAPDGIYGTLGNHDYYIGAETVTRVLGRAGVRWLTNRHACIKRNGDEIFVVGIDDHQLGRPDIKSAMAGLPEEAVRILLMHNPISIEEDSQGYAFDLVLAGHTHGGQILLPRLGAPIMPGRRTRPYRAGWFRQGHSPLYVSHGTGLSSMLPIRMNCPPEFSLFILESEELSAAGAEEDRPGEE